MNFQFVYSTALITRGGWAAQDAQKKNQTCNTQLGFISALSLPLPPYMVANSNYYSEKLAGAKIEHKEVAQSIASQKAKLTEVLNQINYNLQVSIEDIIWYFAQILSILLGLLFFNTDNILESFWQVSRIWFIIQND